MPATASGANIKPACAIEEYARSLTGLDCCNATRLPSVIVSPEIIANIIPQFSPALLKTVVSKIISATKPVALELTDNYAVTGKGAPSYVSGAHE